MVDYTIGEVEGLVSVERWSSSCMADYAAHRGGPKQASL